MSVYPELVGVVGSTVPDYRGIFLRGQGSQTSTHYGTVTHSSAALGQLQGDGIRTIWGTFVGGDWSGHNNQEDQVEPFGLRGMQGYKKAIDTTRYATVLMYRVSLLWLVKYAR